MNIKTLKKIEEEIYMIGNKRLLDVLISYNYGISKRIPNVVVKEEINNIIENIKNLKIIPLGKIDGAWRYLIRVGSYECIFYGKSATKSAREVILGKIKKLENFIKKYC